MIMRKLKIYLFLLGMITLTFGLTFGRCIPAQAQPVLPDIQGNWAQKTIQDFVDKGIVTGYPDGSFKPGQQITRAEFAKLLAKTFNYQAASGSGFPDIRGHWAKSYIDAAAAHKIMKAFTDNSFKPEGSVDRAQIATMLARILNMTRPEEKYAENWPASFTDVPTNHWAFRYIELAKKLSLFPAAYQNPFQPDQPVTRAEAVWMLAAMHNLEVTKGKITQIDGNTGLVNIHAASGDPKLAMITPDTLVLRNNVTSSVDALLNNDTITAIAVPSGDVKLVKAFGEVTKNDLLSRISSFTKGKLSNDEISAIASGDWNTVKDNLKGNLYNKMVSLGLTPAEAESIMDQDWNYLDDLSKQRLAKAIAGQLGISEDLSQALLNKDMSKVKEYGKIELATAALGKLLGNGAPNNNTGNNDPNYDNNTY